MPGTLGCSTEHKQVTLKVYHKRIEVYSTEFQIVTHYLCVYLTFVCSVCFTILTARCRCLLCTMQSNKQQVEVVMTLNPKHRSHIITDGRERAGARAMLKGIGFSDDDLARPIIGVANTWIETMPCNFHLRTLAARVKEGIRAAGGTPMEFNTIAISDGVTMGTEGMKASLVSREIIADSIELVGRGHMFDAVVALVGCDKTIPAGAMALIRLNVPGIVLYGGPIAAGHFQDRDVTIGDVYEAIGAHAAGLMSDDDLKKLENAACPAAGPCGGRVTAHTHATVVGCLGP